MSLPNIPDITPKIDLDSEDAINLILSSIAMEEKSLSCILKAESEKIQHVLCMSRHGCADIRDLKEVNESAERIISSATRMEMLLQMKVQNVLELKKKCPPHPPCKKPENKDPCHENEEHAEPRGPCGADPADPCRGETEPHDPCTGRYYKSRFDFPQRGTKCK